MKEWNPRWVAYARAHGRTPEEMAAHDEIEWPGGRNAGFIVWIGEQWRAWAKAHGHRSAMAVMKGDAEHADFDRMIGAAP